MHYYYLLFNKFIIYYYYVVLSFADTLSQRLVPASDAMTVTPSHTPTLGHLPLGACQPANGSVKPVKCRNLFGESLASSGKTISLLFRISMIGAVQLLSDCIYIYGKFLKIVVER